MKYQKHKLKTMPFYTVDSAKWVIMLENGHDRVWDCGNTVLAWAKNSRISVISLDFILVIAYNTRISKQFNQEFLHGLC